LATGDQLKALIRSHSAGDDETFYAVALQVAAHEARVGKVNLAQELRTLVDERQKLPSARGRRPIPVAQPRGDLAGLLSVAYPDVSLSHLVVEPTLRDQLKKVLVEQRQNDRLRAKGFGPARKLLLIGPPGTGKTMSARMIATQLKLPMFTIRLDGLITKYMGETAAKLRMIFDAIAEVRGVYLFDEVDALAGERSRSNDVGEIRRVLNSFLQFLEEDESESLLVAATNHPGLLDKALFRRFDAVMTFPLPTEEIVRTVIVNRLSNVTVGPLRWPMVQTAARGLSHADITLAAEQAAKDAILSGAALVGTRDLVATLRARKTISH
jgi:SpoVK/Ycf46/Vps4 family AAA+-type ATPase